MRTYIAEFRFEIDGREVGLRRPADDGLWRLMDGEVVVAMFEDEAIEEAKAEAARYLQAIVVAEEGRARAETMERVAKARLRPTDKLCRTPWNRERLAARDAGVQ